VGWEGGGARPFPSPFPQARERFFSLFQHEREGDGRTGKEGWREREREREREA